MRKHNGHRSTNAWHIHLEIHNDEGTYRWAKSLAEEVGIERAARLMTQELGGQRTADGRGVYNYSCIRDALRAIGD